MALKKRLLANTGQKLAHAVNINPRQAGADNNSFTEKFTQFDTMNSATRIAAHDLFSLFTATIIQQKVRFIR